MGALALRDHDIPDQVAFAIAAALTLLCCLWDSDGRRAGGSLQITKPKGEIVWTSPAKPKAQLMGGEGFSHPPLSSPFQPQVPAKDVPVLILAQEKVAQQVRASRCSNKLLALLSITVLQTHVSADGDHRAHQ